MARQTEFVLFFTYCTDFALFFPKNELFSMILRGQTIKNHPQHNILRWPERGKEVIHMSTLRHQKQTISKRTGRESNSKFRHAARKTGRFFGMLFTGGALLTALSGHTQDTTSAPASKPTDKRFEITMANAGKDLPLGANAANTYVVPAKDSPDTVGNRMVAARAKPAGGKNMEPGPDPNQKWCDGIEIENGQMIFRGIEKDGRHGSASIDIKAFLEKYGLFDATTNSIKWQQFRVINGEKKVYFVVEANGMSVLITSNPDFEKGNDTWGKAVFASDGTKIFTQLGTMFATDDGSIVATTPTTLLIIQTGINGKKFAHTYKEMFKEDVILKAPTFEKSAKDVVEMRDETLVTPQGKKVVITIPIYNWDGISAGIDEKFTKN
ncbi:MAG: hypothetical protein NTX79_03815 [Candidatus Micrarchaeota archaeon]|nr:hypothetical protein [Candidatus Micrarchaeota archaeon]